VEFLAELVLEGAEKPNRDLTGELINDFRGEQLAVIGDGTEQFYSLLRVVPVQQIGSVAAGKPRPIQVTPDGFPRLIDCDCRVLIIERVIQSF